MHNLLPKASVLLLAMALIATGCGQAADTATLNVASVPKAEVFVDGVSHGQSGQAISLSAGEHKVELRLERFVSHAETIALTAGSTVTRDVTLAAKDPSDPVVIAKLAECEGIDVAPFVAPETHRGSRSKREVAVLLWPAKHVRKSGLINYAVEADETYDGDATLEFRVGSKVLYREKFNPESVTTVRAIPAEVLEQVKIGRQFTWGLYFEDSRRAIKKRFKIVQRPKAERQLERLASSRHMKRQPQITRQIMAATVLENNRLYTEALVANLGIAREHENSTMPYRGIVTTLRRLDAENSELFAFVSPHVAGKGGRSGVSRPGATARPGGMDLGIGAWLPVQQGGLPTTGMIADNTTGKQGMGPGSIGVTPSGGTSADGATAPTEPGSSTPSTEAGRAAQEREQVTEQMRSEIAALNAESKMAHDEAGQAHKDALSAAEAADAADAAAGEAEARATHAREAVENATDPTREQQETMYQAGMAAEEAREAASSARQAADAANENAQARKAQADEFRDNIAKMGEALNAALGDSATPPGAEVPSASAPAEAEAKKNYDEVESQVAAARKTWDDAKLDLHAAEKAFAADPSEANRASLTNATSTLQDAARHASDMNESLETAKRALESVGSQVQEAGRK